jgi:DNA-directed RNA polymerase specialized sigma24 family protein
VINGDVPDIDEMVGPDERFEELYRAHAGAVRSYVARRIGPDEADDAVAEVFLVVWRRLDDVPIDPLPWSQVDP